MSKKLLLCATTALGLVVAAPKSDAMNYCNPSFRSGMYMGLQAGASMFSDKAKTTLVDRLTPPNFAANPKLSNTGFLGGFHVGYRQFWPVVYAAVELDVDFNSGKASKEFPMVGSGGVGTLYNKVSFTRNYAASLNAKLGGTYGPWVFFGKFGVVMSKFNFKLDLDLRNLTGHGPDHLKKDKSKVGFKFGAGFEYQINAPWSMRTEIDYTMYSDSKISSTGPYFGDPNTTLNSKIKPGYWSLQVGASYKL